MCEIQSFRHAVSILATTNCTNGCRCCWISASRDPSAPALMQTAIARGRFMEQIGAAFFEKAELDNLFITGAFSMLPPAARGQPAVCARRNAPAGPICDALLGGDGVYAPFPETRAGPGSFDEKNLASLANDLHITPERINRAHLEALVSPTACSSAECPPASRRAMDANSPTSRNGSRSFAKPARASISHRRERGGTVRIQSTKFVKTCFVFMPTTRIFKMRRPQRHRHRVCRFAETASTRCFGFFRLATRIPTGHRPRHYPSIP